jgi:hypothetical protein
LRRTYLTFDAGTEARAWSGGQSPSKQRRRAGKRRDAGILILSALNQYKSIYGDVRGYLRKFYCYLDGRWLTRAMHGADAGLTPYAFKGPIIELRPFFDALGFDFGNKYERMEG